MSSYTETAKQNFKEFMQQYHEKIQEDYLSNLFKQELLPSLLSSFKILDLKIKKNFIQIQPENVRLDFPLFELNLEINGISQTFWTSDKEVMDTDLEDDINRAINLPIINAWSSPSEIIPSFHSDTPLITFGGVDSFVEVEPKAYTESGAIPITDEIFEILDSLNFHDLLMKTYEESLAKEKEKQFAALSKFMKNDITYNENKFDLNTLEFLCGLITEKLKFNDDSYVFEVNFDE